MHAWHETKMRLTRPDVENPQLILIVGSVGLALNMLVLSFLHGERTTPRPHLERYA
jgi:Co/Zn/Cd efflux system component